MAEQISIFGIVVGVALLLTGIGLIILAFAVFGRGRRRLDLLPQLDPETGAFAVEKLRLPETQRAAFGPPLCDSGRSPGRRQDFHHLAPRSTRPPAEEGRGRNVARDWPSFTPKRPGATESCSGRLDRPLRSSRLRRPAVTDDVADSSANAHVRAETTVPTSKSWTPRPRAPGGETGCRRAGLELTVKTWIRAERGMPSRSGCGAASRSTGARCGAPRGAGSGSGAHAAHLYCCAAAAAGARKRVVR